MHFSRMPIVAAPAGETVLEPAPIKAEWILSGQPLARASQLASSIDADSFTCLWDCTAGTFRWQFDCDETVHIIEGGVSVRSGTRTIALKAGDTAYFPAGTDTVWTVETYVRKVAFLRLPPPRAISLALRAVRKIKRLLGFGSGAATLATPAT